MCKDTPLDVGLKNLGGVLYTNCFTPGVDTPRGMASFTTGLPPYKNGCNSRLKWPRFFIKNKMKTIYDLFLEKNYKFSFFSCENDRNLGLFPEDISKMNIHNETSNLSEYLSSIYLEEDHLLFIGLNDFHWSLDDNGYTTTGESAAYQDIKKSFDIVFNNLNKDDFEHIFVFSDHGFKFTHEFKFQKDFLLLNEDRTNILMLHRKKGDVGINYNNKLCSITDLMPTMKEVLGLKNIDGVSLFSKKKKKFVIVEDHLSFTPSVNQNIEIWAVVTIDIIYIRTLERGYILFRKSRKVNVFCSEYYDNILKEGSSFGGYIDEHNKLFKYKRDAHSGVKYIHGEKRKKVSKIFHFLCVFKDLIFER
jgi:hypothetical protein